MLPWWRRAMLDYRVRHTGWSDWLRRNAQVLARVKAAVERNGPGGNADFDGRRPPGRGGWRSWRPVPHALHFLWVTGPLTVQSRRHFLQPRALPDPPRPDAVGGAAASA